MKRKYISILLIVMVIMSLIIPISYAVGDIKKEEDSFIKLEQNEVAINGTAKINIDLSKIEYTKFNIEISSTSDIKDIKIDDSSLVEKKSNNEITMQIDKKITSISEINLYYNISTDKKVGDKIELIAKITSLDEENTTNEKELSKSIIIEVISDKQEESNSNNKDEKKDNGEATNKDEKNNINDNKVNSEKQQELTNMNDSKTNDSNVKMSNNADSAKSTTNTISTTVQVKQSQESSIETVQYNGSDNNYLSSLYIDGVEFTKDFAKEVSTYFATVDSTKESLDIVATADDENSSISIYGNDNLNDGVNKVLVFVTAENGNVRTYRIYVTRNA